MASAPEPDPGSVPDEDVAQVRHHVIEAGARGNQGLAGGGGLSRAVRGLPGLRSDVERLHLSRRAQADMAGAGPLQPLLADPQVTDVLVNGDGAVWVDRGRGLVRTQGLALGPVRRLATRLAAAAGQRLDDAAPVAEGRLPDGTRVHAVLSPLATRAAVISLRTTRRRVLSLQEMCSSGFVDVAGEHIMAKLVQVLD